MPNKNLRDLGGKPLLARIVESALAADCARVVVSTDSTQIAEVSRTFGAEVPFLRPVELAGETSSSLSAILQALYWLRDNEDYKPEFLAVCPPTNPFVRPETIRAMFEQLAERPDRNSIVTICAPKTHPFRIVQRQTDGTIINGVVRLETKSINDIERSQDWPVVWEGSPACRISRASYFLGISVGIALPELRGTTYDANSALGYEISVKEALDIDGIDDFVLAEQLLGI